VLVSSGAVIVQSRILVGPKCRTSPYEYLTSAPELRVIPAEVKAEIIFFQTVRHGCAGASGRGVWINPFDPVRSCRHDIADHARLAKSCRMVVHPFHDAQMAEMAQRRPALDRRGNSMKPSSPFARPGSALFVMIFLLFAVFLLSQLGAQTRFSARAKIFAQPRFWPAVGVIGMVGLGAAVYEYLPGALRNFMIANF
jgi:hypothetical protein